MQLLQALLFLNKTVQRRVFSLPPKGPKRLLLLCLFTQRQPNQKGQFESRNETTRLDGQRKDKNFNLCLTFTVTTFSQGSPNSWEYSHAWLFNNLPRVDWRSIKFFSTPFNFSLREFQILPARPWKRKEGRKSDRKEKNKTLSYPHGFLEYVHRFSGRYHLC